MHVWKSISFVWLLSVRMLCLFKVATRNKNKAKRIESSYILSGIMLQMKHLGF